MADSPRIAVIACNTLKEEILHVAKEEGIALDVVWLESQLHNVPKNLTSALQDALDAVEDADVVLFGYGNCGNTVPGLKTGDYELIIPRLDDCISLLIGSQRKRQAYSAEYSSLFQTLGWFDPGHNIIDEYEKLVEKHGEQMAQFVYESMYAHYSYMTFLETGLYSVDDLMEQTKPMCEMLGLEQRTMPATLEWVKMLICGPWPEDHFVHVPPRSVVPTNAFDEYL